MDLCSFRSAILVVSHGKQTPGPNSFISIQFLAKILPNSKILPQTQELPPHVWKILDPSLSCVVLPLPPAMKMLSDQWHQHLPIKLGELSLGVVDVQEVIAVFRCIAHDCEHQLLVPEIESGSGCWKFKSWNFGNWNHETFDLMAGQKLQI